MTRVNKMKFVTYGKVGAARLSIEAVACGSRLLRRAIKERRLSMLLLRFSHLVSAFKVHSVFWRFNF